MGWESSDVFRFHLGPLLQGQLRIAKLKSAYNSLIIGPTGLQCEKKLEIMGWESSDVVRFGLWPPSFQGQNDGSLALVSCLSGGHNLHQFCDAPGLVILMSLMGI